MKLRWLAIAVGLAAFSAGPWTFSQVSDQDKDQPKSGDVQNAPKQAPAALPTADALLPACRPEEPPPPGGQPTK